VAALIQALPYVLGPHDLSALPSGNHRCQSTFAPLPVASEGKLSVLLHRHHYLPEVYWELLRVYYINKNNSCKKLSKQQENLNRKHSAKN